MSSKRRLLDVLTWPNRISLLRLLMVAPFIVLIQNQNEPGWPWARQAALGIFILMAISDALDGQLARRLNQMTRLGAILDPIADKVLIICATVILSLPESAVTVDGQAQKLSNWIVVAVVGKDLWVIFGFLVIYLVTDRFRVRPTVFGKACTIGQLLMVALVLAQPEFNRLYQGLGTMLAQASGWLVVTLCVAAGVSYTRLGLAFVGEGQKPLDK
jgi:cardiolipin synthase (CMP-forming)